ncbi:Pentapeptide repeat-containing protein [Bradyrhizobium sp. Rc3b]|uniref:pentapeptide repeat-containing protein n=1 Tax=unclassified Bradyrhizobium TaxID=2631580 RepID=UPI0008E070E1|nr:MULTISPECIES: pentapeptide repeat-containing protein [unclassified Bradyrhizobium]MBB4375656.1 uncharacterized protein YjbI with pentapeptide repeats [Bradyrhizobium sp. SBR1B]SFN33891.1 Pentapeptide repeat-containing protein [Bradyrhizobium sp. Rc3b]
MFYLIVPLVFIAIFLLGAFFWFWWATPRAQVLLHFDADQIKQLEVQDRLRQTNYQVLTGLGLVATFIAGAVQLWLTSNQWNADYRLRLDHERGQQFAEATRSLVDAPDKPYAQVAAQRITSLVSESPGAFGQQAITILESVVVDGTKANRMQESGTCDAGDPTRPRPVVERREEPPPAAQAAIRQLGGGVLSRVRSLPSGRLCAGDRRLNLANLGLDNFDLSGLDLSCSVMTQAQLRRVSLRYANLFGADLGGASLADWDVPGSPASSGWLWKESERPKQFEKTRFTAESIGFDETDPAPKKKEERKTNASPKLDVWQTYRCFITDLRNADLRGVNFENASLGGADFRNADLTGANLCGATVSRANFRDAKGLTTAMLRQVCVGRFGDDEDTIIAAQPLGLEPYFSGEFRRVEMCGVRRGDCQPSADQTSKALNRPRR